MNRIDKNEMKKQIAVRLRQLQKREGVTSESLIMHNYEILSRMAAYYGDVSSREALTYIRRLIDEIINDPQYECQDIRRLFTKQLVEGKKRVYKRQWAWVNTSDDQKEDYINLNDAKISGSVRKTLSIARVLKTKTRLKKTKDAMKEYEDEIITTEEQNTEEEIQQQEEVQQQQT